MNAAIGEWPAPRQVTATEKKWRTPALPVAPLQYYRVRFRSQTKLDGSWAAVFFDKDGHELVADHYDIVFASDDWREHECCVRAHFLAAELKLHFDAPPEQDLGIRDLTVAVIGSTARKRCSGN
jgi:hypothetical protein